MHPTQQSSSAAGTATAGTTTTSASGTAAANGSACEGCCCIACGSSRAKHESKCDRDCNGCVGVVDDMLEGTASAAEVSVAVADAAVGATASKNLFVSSIHNTNSCSPTHSTITAGAHDKDNPTYVSTRTVWMTVFAVFECLCLLYLSVCVCV